MCSMSARRYSTCSRAGLITTGWFSRILSRSSPMSWTIVSTRSTARVRRENARLVQPNNSTTAPGTADTRRRY